MQIKLRADGRTASGGAPLVLHNERLADPIDSFTQALAELTGKRKKTLEDHVEIARREFLGGLYMNPSLEWIGGGGEGIPRDYEGVVALPSWNVLRCLQDGAKRSKRGPDILRGVSPLSEYAEIQYDGPSHPVELWQDGGFSLRKSVGVQRSRTMRTRPIFVDWTLELECEVDPKVLDTHTIRFMWKDAGLYAGLGEMRPVYGKFLAEVDQLSAPDEAAEVEDDPAPPRRRASRRRTVTA